jgi:hypothetical protein
MQLTSFLGQAAATESLAGIRSFVNLVGAIAMPLAVLGVASKVLGCVNGNQHKETNQPTPN